MNKEEFENLLLLSKLELDKEEEKEILKDMEEIINFVDKINSVEVEKEAENNENFPVNVLRKDEVLKSYPQEEILKNSKTVEDGFFYLKNAERTGGN